MTMRITRLALDNWRNFKRVDIPIRQRMFVVGPNASGKSNLLDALRFLRDVASVGGGFQEALTSRGGVSSVRCLAARRNPDVRLCVSIGTDSDPDQWTYELRFGTGPNRRDPVVRAEHVLRRGEEILQRPDADDEADPARLSQTALEQVNANRDFREVFDFFASVQYLHVVPQLVREPDRSRGKVNDPFGGDLVEQIARTSPRTRDARLRKILSALKIAMPQLAELRLESDARGDWHLRGKYEHWRKPGAWQSEVDFSDGTLRLLGLLWSLLSGAGPLLLEEPELSLHAEVVRFLPSLFARAQRSPGRQVLVSTHSVDLLADPGIGLDEVMLLEPTGEGTTVSLASSIDDAKTLLQHGTTLPELITPRTRPRDVEQLALFRP
jgi:predicted ATPase